MTSFPDYTTASLEDDEPSEYANETLLDLVLEVIGLVTVATIAAIPVVEIIRMTIDKI